MKAIAVKSSLERKLLLHVAAAAIVAAFVVLFFGSFAHAESLRDSGTFEDARLEADSRALPVATAGGAHHVASRGTSAQQGGVKQWAKEQWHSLRSLWSDAPAKTIAQVPSAAKQASQVARVPASAPAAAAAALPSARPVERRLVAPSANSANDERGPVDVPGMKRTATGVSSYDLSSSPSIPRLHLDREERVTVGRYALDERLEKIMNDRVVHPLMSPDLMTPEQMKATFALRQPAPGEAIGVKEAVFGLKGKVSRESFDKIAINHKVEPDLHLKKFIPLTPDEVRFLSALLIMQEKPDGQQCPVAVGLFHQLSKVKSWEAEANYFMATCSKKMGLITDFYERTSRVLATRDDPYTKRIFSELGTDVPYEQGDVFGEALMKAVADAKMTEGVTPETMANVAYLMADFGVSSERFKTALSWAKQVPPTHPKYLKAQFLQALAEYQAGSKSEAMKIQDTIVGNDKIDKTQVEFQALVALNAARMHFQEREFKAADENFHRVYKDHPLWLQSLTEMGWAQLMSGDYEGAIGNMYSIQSPFFNAVYKPESYVIRTIGYLNLCQYGDAYKTLSILEHDYRPSLEKMDAYITRSKGKPAYYQTVKSFFTAAKDAKEIDGLPMPVIREMARHRDFINLQKALNRQVDERPNYAAMDGVVEARLKRAQANVTTIRKQADDLRKRLASYSKHPDPMISRAEMNNHLEATLVRLNDAFFQVDLYTEAKNGMDAYRKEVVVGAENRIVATRGTMEKTLADRLLHMKVDLARVLDNNELLRYEVFSGSGENIRYQVAGGEIGNRIPASVLPKSKSLQWDFDGEYWEDEIGHYRSSLKNNCPQENRAQASVVEGGSR